MNKMKIDDCDEKVAFVTNENGYDVVKIERYVPSEIANDEHRNNLLTDEQWQKVIDTVNDCLKSLKT